MSNELQKDIIAEYPSISALIQTEEERKYIDGITVQHFKSENDPNTNNIGSCIYSESCPDALNVLELIADKLGKDDSKDREFLMQKGAPQSCMLPFAKYYSVNGIRGKCRIVSVKELSDSTLVTLVPSPKGTPSLVISAKDAPESALREVDYATVIVGPADGREGETIWTMHAGHPAPLIPIQKNTENVPLRDDQGRMVVPETTGWKYGDQIPISDVKSKLGEDVFISILN